MPVLAQADIVQFALCEHGPNTVASLRAALRAPALPKGSTAAACDGVHCPLPRPAASPRPPRITMANHTGLAVGWVLGLCLGTWTFYRTKCRPEEASSYQKT